MDTPLAVKAKMKRVVFAILLAITSWGAGANELVNELRESARCHINTFNHQECEYNISGFRVVIAGIGTDMPGIHFREVDPEAQLQVTTGVKDFCVLIARGGYDGLPYQRAFISPATGGVFDEPFVPECVRK